MRPRRDREAGVSLIEALLMLAVLAIVAALVFDFVQGSAVRAMQRGFLAADKRIEALTQERFRAIVANAAGAETVVGNADALALNTLVGAPGPCSAWPGSGRLVLSLVREGGGATLLCRSARGAETLARWPGAARFSYSADGVIWSDTWRPGATPPFVRLEAEGVRWIARPGARPQEPAP